MGVGDPCEFVLEEVSSPLVVPQLLLADHLQLIELAEVLRLLADVLLEDESVDSDPSDQLAHSDCLLATCERGGVGEHPDRLVAAS